MSVDLDLPANQNPVSALEGPSYLPRTCVQALLLDP
jgi:hypothetical protein